MCVVGLAVLILAVPVSAVTFKEFCYPNPFVDELCRFSDPDSEFTNFRPISDFLETQGAYCVEDPDTGECLLFDPPVPDFLFFEDVDDFKVASFDYAGVAAKILGAQARTKGLGMRTKMKGLVRERPRPDGAVDVQIVLKTEKALAWVAQDATLETMLFGARVAEILEGVEGAEPVFGKSRLQVYLINFALGAPLPDLVQSIVEPATNQQMVFFVIAASARGKLRAAFNGLPAGTPVKLKLSAFVDFDHGGLDSQVTLSPPGPRDDFYDEGDE